MKTFYYSGIGSRDISKDIFDLFTRLAIELCKIGGILRTGNADGSDKAFRTAVKDSSKKEVYTPQDATKESIKLAMDLHPKPEKCNGYVQKLLGRNSFQILGPNLDDPVSFVLCWTPDGVTEHRDRTIATGGTGTAISIADTHDPKIKVWNLRQASHRRIWEDWLKAPSPLLPELGEAHAPRKPYVMKKKTSNSAITKTAKKSGFQIAKLKDGKNVLIPCPACEKETIQVYVKDTFDIDNVHNLETVFACPCGLRDKSTDTAEPITKTA
jgi:hypothetical protein